MTGLMGSAVMALVAASPAPAATLGFAVDGTEHAQRDLQASPLIYDGLQGSLVLEARQAPGRWRVEQELSGRYGWLSPVGVADRAFSVTVDDPVTGDDEVFPVSPPRGDVGGAGALELRHALGDGGFDLGLRLEADALMAFGMPLDRWGWFMADLGPSAAFTTRPWEGGQLRLHLTVLVAAVVTRSPRSLDPWLPDRRMVPSFFASGTRLASLDTHQRVAVDAELELGSGRWRGLVAAHADWLHDALPDHLYRLRAGLRIGVRLALGSSL
jgi:hypothetical protein